MSDKLRTVNRAIVALKTFSKAFSYAAEAMEFWAEAQNNVSGTAEAVDRR